MSQHDEELEIPEQTSAPGGVRGKYYDRYMQGTTVVPLAPDIAEVFRVIYVVHSVLAMEDLDSAQLEGAQLPGAELSTRRLFHGTRNPPSARTTG